MGALALVVLCVAVYLPSMRGEFVSDDLVYVTGDTRLHSVEGLGAIWTDVAGPGYRHQYYPMTSTGFWIQYRLFGDRPTGYHLVNVLLHAANAFLVWRLLLRLGLRWAWVAGAIFAVHPVHAQSVAWIAELKNTLSAFFALLAACVFVDSMHLGGVPPRHPRLHYALGMALALAGLAAKTATCLLPVALLLVVWWKRGRPVKRDLAVIAPLAAMGGAFVALTVALEAGHGGAAGESFALSFFERLLVAGRSVWFYAGKLIWPSDLSFIYPRWTIDATAVWQWLFPAATAAALATLVVLRDRIGRGPATAAGYFAVALIPVCMVNVSYHAQSFVADHWQYFASVGLIAIVSCGLARWPQPRVAMATAGALVMVLGALTWNRAHVYSSARALWSDTLERNPQAWAAHSNMGTVLVAEGRLEPAIAHFRQAIRIRAHAAGAHDNLGAALARTGSIDEAIVHLKEAVRLRPGVAPFHMHLGIALGMQGRRDEAVANLRDAVRCDPGFAPAHFNLGIALRRSGDRDAAIASFRHAVALVPGEGTFRRALGETLLAGGYAAEGVMQLRAAAAEPGAARISAVDPG